MQEPVFFSSAGGSPVYHLSETESTMSVARELVAGGAPSGTAVYTDFQSSGRGRLPGRSWTCEPGDGLLFTLAVEEPSPRGAPLRAGLAVAEAIESLGAPGAPVLEARIKWPNDVLLGGRKVCGILCEYVAPWLYVGVGVNLRQRTFPGGLIVPATSLALQGVTVSPEDLLERILARWPQTRNRWLHEVAKRLWRLDEEVTVNATAKAPATGRVRGLDSEGRLLVERNGATVAVVAGELDEAGGLDA